MTHDIAARTAESGCLAFDAELPAGLLYRPEFVSHAQEAALLRSIAQLPLHEAAYKSYTARRRIASFGSSYDFDRNELDQAPAIPAFLLPLREQVAAWTGLASEAFGQVLISEYRPATPLGWHRDVPQFAIIVGVSLAASCRMRFRPYPPRPGRDPRTFVLELAPRSAYVLRDDIRWRWQHRVAPTKSLRYSVTFRTAARTGMQRRVAS